MAINNIKAYIYKWVSDRYMSGCSHYNSLQVRRATRSKGQAREVFNANNVPYAKGLVFFNPLKAYDFVKQYGFPVVVKPNVSGYSRGSYFPITNYGELNKALLMARLWWPKSVIEQYLLGSNYRVVAIKDRLASVIQRYPPFIIGDGKHNIDRLIDIENKVRRNKNLFPIMYPIEKSHQVIKHLKKQGVTLQSVPANEKRVELFYRVALAPGGVVETIDQESISSDNKKLFIEVVNMFDANILGIDVIFEKGIEHSYKNQKCIFIEVNSRPYLKMHHAPRYGKTEDLSDFYKHMDALEIQDKDIY